MEQKMIENILNKYVIEAPSMGRSVILADRIDEVADDIRQFLLQQTPCTTLREIMQQKVEDCTKARETLSYNSIEDIEKAQELETAKWVISLIDACQPVA